MVKPSDFTLGATVLSPDRGYWRVIGISKNGIVVSGPGPCRSVKTVEGADLEGWQPIVPA